MKRLTNVLQIVAVVLAAFFIACLFTSQFPPWKSNRQRRSGRGEHHPRVGRHHCSGRRRHDCRGRRRGDDRRAAEPAPPGQRALPTARRCTRTTARPATARPAAADSGLRSRGSRTGSPKRRRRRSSRTGRDRCPGSATSRRRRSRRSSPTPAPSGELPLGLHHDGHDHRLAARALAHEAADGLAHGLLQRLGVVGSRTRTRARRRGARDRSPRR